MAPPRRSEFHQDDQSDSSSSGLDLIDLDNGHYSSGNSFPVAGGIEEEEEAHHLSPLLGRQDSSGMQHMVDMIDPDAVDFEPFLINSSGTAVNYHTSEHPEHQQLLRRMSTNKLDPSPPTQSRHFQLLSMMYHYLELALHRLGYGMARLQTWLLQAPSSSSAISSPRSTKSITTSSVSNDERGGPRNYLMIFMVTFLCLVFLSKMMHATNTSLAGVAAVGTTEMKPIPTTIMARNQQHEGTTTQQQLPSQLERAYQSNHVKFTTMTDTPVYWHIPRAAGTTMKFVLSQCLDRVVGCEQGAWNEKKQQLEILQTPFGRFVNVDTTTTAGIQRGAELGLIPSRMVDVVVTPHVWKAARLFPTKDRHHFKGRLFALFRHPLERLVSLYYYLQGNHKDLQRHDVHNVTLEQFASDFSENWMVRTLTNHMTGPMDQRYLDVAKELLRQKFLIGLLEELPESLRRFEAYFGWAAQHQSCTHKLVFSEPRHVNPHPSLDKNSRAYQILQNRNRYDLELYEYAKFLFEEQRSLIGE